jgi:hypothetical protein
MAQLGPEEGRVAELPPSPSDLPRMSSDALRTFDALLRSGARTALAGDVAAAGGMADVIAFVHQNRWSGSLRVLSANVVRVVRFQSGEVCAAFSPSDEHRFGEVVFRYGKISRADLDRALLGTGAERRIGQVLIDLGILTPHDVFAFVKKQIEDICFSVLATKQGTFVFERVEAHQVEGLHELGLSTQRLLFEAAQRMDELQYFRERIPTGREVPVLRSLGGNLVPMQDGVRVILALVDGKRTVNDITLQGKLGEHETLRCVVQLMQAGRVELRHDKDVLKAGQLSGCTQVVEAMNQLLAACRMIFERTGAATVLRTELQRYFESHDDLIFQGIALDEQITLSEERLLANLSTFELDDPVGRLRQSLNDLACFVLFLAGDFIGSEAERELNVFLVERALDTENESEAVVPPRPSKPIQDRRVVFSI